MLEIYDVCVYILYRCVFLGCLYLCGNDSSVCVSELCVYVCVCIGYI